MWFSVYIRSHLWTCCSLVLTFCNMAQLPPKVPTITPNWPDFSYQKMEALSINHHHHTPTTPTAAAAPSWVDEFLDFSSARRGSHRRSMSDSVAFLEPPMVDECRSMRHSSTTSLAAGPGGGPGDFDRFDDDQLMSMFNDDGGGVGPTVSCSNPSSPSDHNSINDDEKQGPSDHPNPMLLLPQGQQQPKSEPEEDDSSCKSDGINGSGEKIADPKRIKRILANRQSAQRSRVRKLQYISELERSVSSLQAEVSVLSPRVAFLDHQRLVLNVDNSVLKQRIAALAQDKVFKDAHQEALKREIERLRQIYYHQNLKNGDKVADTNCSAEKEQLAVN